MTNDDRNSELERIAESANRVAGDGYQLFRINLVLVGIFLSAFAIISQDMSTTVQTRIIRSYYTQGSVALWLISCIIGYFAYEPARRLSAMWLYDKPQEIVNKHASTARLSFNIRYGMLLSLLSVVSFGIGVLDGILPIGIKLQVISSSFFVLLFIGALPVFASIGWRRIKGRMVGL